MDAEIEHLRRRVADLTEANAALERENDDRKRAEEALRASEVGLLKIINALPTTAWSTRPDGYCDFLSSRWLDYAGFTAEQAEGWGWKAAIHPDDASSLVEGWYAALATGTPVEAEARIRRFDGAYRWFLFRANPLRDEQGTIIKWYGTLLNLLLNASDAMKGVDSRQRLVVIRTAGTGEGVKLSVEDAGVGFANEDVERLFQAFYTTKSSGMGIGLSVSRSIIESHHGRIWGEPNAGPGATFSFCLPVGVKGASAPP